MDVDRSKNHATAVQLCKTADSLLESKQIDVSLDYYTLGLLYSPAIYKKELSTDDNEGAVFVSAALYLPCPLVQFECFQKTQGLSS